MIGRLDSFHLDDLHVLYADDEDYVRRAFARTLGREGIQVTLASSGEEALAMIAGAPDAFSVVAADYHMGPGMDGATFLSEVSAVAPSATRVLISGQIDVPRLVQAVNSGGIYQIVSKPWEPEDLLPLIRRAGERCQLGRDNQRLLAKLERKNRELERLNQHLDELVLRRTSNLLDGLISALDLRDSETQCHSRRVSAFARRLGEAYGLSGEELLDVSYGALLHDIGKIGVSDGILLKAGPLTDAEWAVMKTHPRLGFELLRDIDFLGGAREIVFQHHERWDARGYPRAIGGGDVVIGARIFSVADAFDVITSDRPYRRARSTSIARAELEKHAGAQFDPRVVEAFLSVPEEEWSEIRASFTRPGSRAKGLRMGDDDGADEGRGIHRVRGTDSSPTLLVADDSVAEA